MWNIKQITLMMVLAGMTITANAVPNFWTSSMSQGYIEYHISNNKEQGLLIACNVTAGDDFEHAIYFYPNVNRAKTLSLDDRGVRLSFLFDGKKTAYPLSSSKSRSGSTAWIDFTQGISKARKIEVFNKNKKIAIFTPSVRGIREVAKLDKDCEPLW